MRNYWKSLTLVACLVLGGAATNVNHADYCIPENNLYIGVDDKSISSMDEKTFNHVIDVVEELYKPIIAELGGDLQIERNWEDGTVNAYAQRIGKVYKVSMFGGLARHETITPDGFALVVCHEVGHHIGGAPKKASWMGALTWASNEGQADYWGATKCMKKVADALEESPLNTESKDYKIAVKECDSRYESEQDKHVCVRSSMAGKSLAELFKVLGNSAAVSFSTKDPKVVTATNHNHPAAQCRMDTYFAGSLCNKDADAKISDTDAKLGFCNKDEGLVAESRPLCWFKP